MQNIFSDARGHGWLARYFMNFEVAGRDPIQAEKLARERAQELGLKVVGVEEIAEKSKSCSSDPQVLSTSGKSYFPTGH